ncbi:MAG: glycosyltransferase family 4 protein [Alsobacter sp.]
MKILLPTLYGNLGGSTRVLLAAAEALRAEHEVHVRAPRPEADSRTGPALPGDAIDTPARKLAAMPRLGWCVLREVAFLRRLRPDLIHVHDEIALYVWGTAGRIAGVPVLWHVHMREGVGRTRALRDRLSSAKLFISRHSVGEGQTKPHAVIRNPVTPPALALHPTDGRLRLAVIGTLSDRKNQALAVETVAALAARGRPASLDLYGESLDRRIGGRLQALATEHGVTRKVRRHGHTPLGDALAATDVLLAPSTYENQPLIVLEALAAGIPVVASDIPAHREIAALLNTPALTLCPADPDAFADAAAAARPDPSVVKTVARAFGPQRFGLELRDFVADLATKGVVASR